MEVAAIEYVENEARERFIYDININTNYNQSAEKAHGKVVGGMSKIAIYLGESLSKLEKKSETKTVLKPVNLLGEFKQTSLRQKQISR